MSASTATGPRLGLSPAQRRWSGVWGSARPATRLTIALPRPWDEATLCRRWEELRSLAELRELGGGSVWRLTNDGSSLVVEAPSSALDAGSAVLVAEALLGSRKLGTERYADVASWWSETLLLRHEESVVRWDDYDLLCACPAPLPWGTASPSGALQPRHQDVPLDANAQASIRRCAALRGVSVADLLCAAWLVFLARWTDTESLLLAEIFSGRALEELRGVVGPLERALPLRFDPQPSQTFAEIVRLIHTERSAAAEVQDYFLLNSEPGTATYLPFSFVCREPRYDGPGHIEALSSLIEPFAMQLEVCVTSTSLTLNFGTDANLIAGLEAASALAAWSTLLAAFVADPSLTIVAPPLSSCAGLAVGGWRLAGAKPPHFDRTTSPAMTADDRDLTRALETAMREHANHPALLGDGVSITYRELDRRTRELAERWAGQGLHEGARVAVAMTSSVEAVIAIVAVLRAGCAYVPLDPNEPAERLQTMLGSSGAKFLVRDSALEAVIGAVCSDESPLAYIIFTSGSTGTPKGVAVPRRAVTALAAALHSAIYDRFGPHRRVAMLAALTFDASVQQIFAALLGGHALLPVALGVKRDPAALCDLLAAQRIEIADGTPSLLELMVRHTPDRLRGLSVAQWIIGGEPLTRDLVRRFLDVAATGVSVANVYGLTETGVDSTLAWLGPEDGRTTRSVPIGRPLPNAEVLLLDSAGRVLPCGAVGEIAIAGPGLALGYVGDPALTAARFVPHPFLHGQRICRTGDRGWIDADGAFHFVERRDEQVKVRGHRVDLGEVRTALLSCAGVEQAHVLLHRDGDGQTELAAFVSSSPSLSRAALRAHLKKRLAEPMRPRILIEIDEWPLTTSGKLDRKALLARATAPETAQGAASNDPADRLIAIFRRITGDPYLTAEDDFFDAGGNSLAALEAIAQIASELGSRVDVRTIYQARTAAGLDRILRSRQSAPSRLVQLRPARPDSPDLFLLPPAFGVSHIFLPLAARLPAGVNVWGIDYRSADQPLEPSVETLAAALLAELPSRTAGHPIALAGYSAGAFLAFEMARLLERRGRQPRLILIDARSERDQRSGVSSAGGLVPNVPLLHAREISAIAALYQPPHAIRANLAVLEAADNPSPARMESWRPWTSGRFRIASLPGTHDTLLHPAHIGELARQIELSLQFLEGGPHAPVAADATDVELRRHA